MKKKRLSEEIKDKVAIILTKYHFGKLHCVIMTIIHQVVGKDSVLLITVAIEQPFLFLILEATE